MVWWWLPDSLGGPCLPILQHTFLWITDTVIDPPHIPGTCYSPSSHSRTSLYQNSILYYSVFVCWFNSALSLSVLIHIRGTPRPERTGLSSVGARNSPGSQCSPPLSAGSGHTPGGPHTFTPSPPPKCPGHGLRPHWHPGRTEYEMTIYQGILAAASLA